MTKSPAKKYFRYNVLLLVFPILIFCISYVVLSSFKEGMTMDEIVGLQHERGGLYLSALPRKDKQLFEYKLSLYRKIKPDIIALGSSRLLLFKAEDFNLPFTNLGLTMSDIEQGFNIADDLLKIKIPKIVILGADFWWFSDWRTLDTHDVNQKFDGLKMNLEETLLPFKWKFQNKISLKQTYDAIFGNPSNFGTIAIAWKDGYDKFGSQHMDSIVRGLRSGHNLPEVISQSYVKGQGIRGHNLKFSVEKMERYKSLISKFTSAGSHVVVIIPPNMGIINKILDKTDNSGFIDEFREEITNVGVNNFDYHDATNFGSNDCEFLDSWHGGEVTYLRMLLDISEHDEHILKVIHQSQVSDLIEKNSGNVSVSRDDNSVLKEVDFLNLGCTKSR